jgi:signal transduction histidine kinase
MRFRDAKLATKQSIGLGLIFAILALGNFYSLRKMATIESEIDEVTSNRLPRAIAVSDISLSTSNLRTAQLQYALTRDPERKREQAAAMLALLERIDDDRDRYERLKRASETRDLYSERERELYEQNFEPKWERYLDLSYELVQIAAREDNRAAVDLLVGEGRRVFEDFGRDLEGLVDANKTDSYEAGARAEFAFHAARRFNLTLLVVTALVSALVAVALVRLITVPVQQLERAAEQVAAGDLETRVDIDRGDEIGSLGNSFDQMTRSLQETRERTRQQAEELRAQHETVQGKNRDLEQAMQQLRESQEQLVMREKMAALGDLVAGLAHEINSPVGTVLSSADVSRRCLQRVESTLDEALSLEGLRTDQALLQALGLLETNTANIATASTRITTLVDSLKNFARLDESERQQVDITEGIESSLTLMEHEFRGRVAVETEFADLPAIQCYPGQLNQVFISLLKNSAQAIGTSGTIRIRSWSENDTVVVRIADTGVGIPPEKLGRIFDFGFSAGGTRVKLASGLSTAYNIVQNHNGSIDIESEVGSGTTVSVALPIT